MTKIKIKKMLEMLFLPLDKRGVRSFPNYKPYDLTKWKRLIILLIHNPKYDILLQGTHTIPYTHNTEILACKRYTKINSFFPSF